MLKRFAFPIDLQYFNGGDHGGNDNADNGGNNSDGNQNTGDDNQNNDKTFTQAELDEIIKKRLAREKKSWEQQLEEEKKKAAMTEAERLKAEKEEAERKAKEAQQAANQRLITAEAKVQAAALGVKPEKLSYVLKLADLSDVEVDENGSVDEKAVKAAVEKVLKDLPELASTGTSRGGGDFNTGTPPKDIDDQIKQAQEKGNWREVIKLQRQKMFGQK